ncbi:hypothetical protein [Pseudolysobacter antarcticus]|uniref:hypothetical protein n=1 Tax=Pseudolysobacter antarcticus TaxID=2511995 RepID=UPI0013EC9449|nr:hypothetical protein [Pseudolysobacter antarcticus]
MPIAYVPARRGAFNIASNELSKTIVMTGKTDKTAVALGAYSGNVQSCRPHTLSRDGAKKEIGAQG